MPTSNTKHPVKMKYKIEMAPLADYYVIAVKDKTTGELKETFTLNESGADMLRLFCEGKDAQTIAVEIAKDYDAPIEMVTRDVMRFIDRLRQKGLV
jgi:hypothetical protein